MQYNVGAREITDKKEQHFDQSLRKMIKQLHVQNEVEM
jgi:hypothetical protein